MTDVLMHESRRLELPLETLVDVLVEFESMCKRWPDRPQLEGARLEPGGIVLALKPPQREPAERT